MKIITCIIWLLPQIACSQNNWDTAWVRTYGGPAEDYGVDLRELNDRGLIIVGTTNSFGDGLGSFYLIRTDRKGNKLWTTSVGTSGRDICQSVELTTDNGFLLVGYSNGNSIPGYDGLVVKTNSSGEQQWHKFFGGKDWDFLYNSCSLPDSAILLCGETTVGDATQNFLIKIDQGGNILWSKTFGGSGNDALYSIEYTNGFIYAVGQTLDSLSQLEKAIVYKLTSNGEVLTQKIFEPTSNETSAYLDLFITQNSQLLICGRRTDVVDHRILEKLDTSFARLGYDSDTQNFFLECIIEGANQDIYSVGAKEGGAGGLAAYFARFGSDLGYKHSADFGGTFDDRAHEIIMTTDGYAMVGSTESYGSGMIKSEENVYLVTFNKHQLVNDYNLDLKHYLDTLSLVALNEETPDAGIGYPNPAIDDYFVKLPNSENAAKSITYQIRTISGEVLVTNTATQTDTKTIKLDLSNLSVGLYFYDLTASDKIIKRGKIVICR